MPIKNKRARQEARLAQRRDSYEATCNHRADRGKGFNRPGSIKK